jgi:outer membrane protein assembly factor BamE
MPTVVQPYRIDIQQGNLVTQDMIAKLKPGMTRAQVRFALGSPLVVDPFRTDRWDYVYSMEKQGRPVERRHIIVIFEDDKLVRVEGDVKPDAALATPADDRGAPAASAPVAGKTATPAAGAPARVAPAAQATTEPTTVSSSADSDAAAQSKGFWGRLRGKLGF